MYMAVELRFLTLQYLVISCLASALDKFGEAFKGTFTTVVHHLDNGDT